MPKQSNDNKLCHAGELLELQFQTSSENLLKATATLQETCKEIAETVTELRDYAIRDLGRIEVLEKSKDCKSQKIKEIEGDAQKLAVSFATHKGEHKQQEKMTKTTGTRAGVIGAVPTSGVIIGVFEFLRYLFIKQ